MEKRFLVILTIMASIMTMIYASEPINDCKPTVWPTAGIIKYEFNILPNSEIEKFPSDKYLCIEGAPNNSMKVIASASGKIQSIDEPEKGHFIISIDHGCGYISRYAFYAVELNVKLNEQVKRFKILGYPIQSNNENSAQVFYSVELNGKPINPKDLMD